MKNILLTTVSIFVFLLIIFIIVLGYIDIPNQLRNDTEKKLKIISKDLINGNLKSETINTLPKNTFYAIWLKDSENNFIPILFDKRYANLLEKKPQTIYNEDSYKMILYEKRVLKFDYIVLINRFQIDFYIKNILIPILLIVIIYLILVIVISFTTKNSSYNSKRKNLDSDIDEEDSEDNENHYEESDTKKEKLDPTTPLSYELSNEEFNGLLGDKESEENNFLESGDEVLNEILEDYKELWVKHFKISDDFKSNFPFVEILNHIKFNTTPESYITKSLESSKKYFKWINPKIYINQYNNFVECQKKEILDTKSINIPIKGDQKGDIFIPLYPYSLSTIFGYLNFQWQQIENFQIADILYFLKFLFSDEAKNLFVNYKDSESIINGIKKSYQSDSKIFFALIDVDKKEKLKLKLKKVERENLNSEIFENLNSFFEGYQCYNIFSFSYLVFGTFDKKEKILDLVTDWITDYDKHTYTVTHLDENLGENILVTFSSGIKFKDNLEEDLKPL